MHATHATRKAVFHSFGIVVKPLLDTALAAALCGYGESVGLGTLLKSCAGVAEEGPLQAHWSLRPLPPPADGLRARRREPSGGAGQGVAHRLDQLGRREWALAFPIQYEDPNLYEPRPEEIAQRLFRAVSCRPRITRCCWNWSAGADCASGRSCPRKWLSDDSTLMTLAVALLKTWTSCGRSGAFRKTTWRGKAKPFWKPSAADEQGEAPGGIARSSTAEEARVIDLIRVYVNLLADEHEVAASICSIPASISP